MNSKLYSTHFEREIDTPLEKVWHAWADNSKWSAWVLMEMKNDFRTGGKYDNGNGEGGTYLEIILLEKIRFSWEMKRYKPGSEITATFREISEQKTLCMLDHTNLQSESDQKDSELGWSWAMDSLKSYLEKNKPLSWEEWESLNSK